LRCRRRRKEKVTKKRHGLFQDLEKDQAVAILAMYILFQRLMATFYVNNKLYRIDSINSNILFFSATSLLWIKGWDTSVGTASR
jgi:hypothetical protein